MNTNLVRISKLKKKIKAVYHPDVDLEQEIKDFYRHTKPDCKIEELTDKEIERALDANSLTADFY